MSRGSVDWRRYRTWHRTDASRQNGQPNWDVLKRRTGFQIKARASNSGASLAVFGVLRRTDDRGQNGRASVRARRPVGELRSYTLFRIHRSLYTLVKNSQTRIQKKKKKKKTQINLLVSCQDLHVSILRERIWQCE